MQNKPLAYELRPRSIEEYVGQTHLLGEGGALKTRLKIPFSMICWGPPGVGKTSLAFLLTRYWNTHVIELNATLSNLNDIKSAIQEATHRQMFQEKTVIIIDEIHRFSKTQQEALLSVVENGTLILLATTTENPKYAVIPGLMSRCMIYECKSLNEEALLKIYDRAVTKLPHFQIDKEAKQTLLSLSGGDARKMCHVLEGIQTLSTQVINTQDIQKIYQQSYKSYSKDQHYHLISELIKSMRDSKSEKAIECLAKLLKMGEDPLFIARRLVIFASEDIGLEDSQALLISSAILNSIKDIGMPESRILLSHGVMYLSAAKKNKNCYVAIENALEKSN